MTDATWTISFHKLVESNRLVDEFRPEDMSVCKDPFIEPVKMWPAPDRTKRDPLDAAPPPEEDVAPDGHDEPRVDAGDDEHPSSSGEDLEYT